MIFLHMRLSIFRKSVREGDLRMPGQNDDCKMVAHAISILKQQYQNGQDDIAALERMKQEALQDPLAYVTRLEQGTLEEHPPTLQAISLIPEISLEKYRRTRPLTLSSSRRALPLSTEEKMIEMIISRIVQLQKLERKSFPPAKIVAEHVPPSVTTTTAVTLSSGKTPLQTLEESRKLFRDFLPVGGGQGLGDSSTSLSTGDRMASMNNSPNSLLSSPDQGSVDDYATMDPNSASDDLVAKRRRYDTKGGQRGRPPGTIRRIPWSEQETAKLREWMSTNAGDLAQSNYESIISQLRTRTLHDIRTRIQYIQHRELLLPEEQQVSMSVDDDSS